MNYKKSKRPNIFYVKYLFSPYRAMTIPPIGIFIKKEYKGNKSILKHDLIHWHQYKKYGFILFYFRYFMQLLLIGYDLMPMEIEARQSDILKNKYNYSQIYHKNKKIKNEL